MEPRGPCAGCIVDGMVTIAEAMLEETQTAARYAVGRDVMILLAKRDALSELVRRLRGGGRNPNWVGTQTTWIA